MQDPDWNDMRFVLALARTGRLAAAARRLGVDDTTVARRVAAAERALGAPLFLRARDGRRELTGEGLAILPHAERMEAEAERLAAAAKGAAAAPGTVRITATPIIANRLITPASPPFLAAHPELTIALLPDGRDYDLARREADLAIRLARPRKGGGEVKARRVGALGHGVFRAASGDPDPPWIAYEEASGHLPQAKWMAQIGAAPLAPLRVSDAETALEAAASGLGQAVLPLAVAVGDRRLKRVDIGAPPPSRDVWLLSPAGPKPPRFMRAVMDWLAGLNWSGEGDETR